MVLFIVYMFSYDHITGAVPVLPTPQSGVCENWILFHISGRDEPSACLLIKKPQSDPEDL